MSRTYIWILKLVDVNDKPIVRLVSGVSSDHAKARAEKAFLCPRERIKAYGGFRTLEAARYSAVILFPNLVDFE